ncbi:PH domain-containing protein [Salipaludibacillus daqingensis]|uniref:PH domain-containing protein n=1 Tax=Salipaludibacillus daqingensis TaxID=3041001 RepID=UPI0024762C97|nr:PH domain-containing protein [Salipaludibacillus daqingensis]
MGHVTYYPITSDRLVGKLRKYHMQIIILFYGTILAIIGLSIYGFFNPTVFQFSFYYHLFIMSFIIYFTYKPPLPHNYKQDTSKQLSYELEDDALVISFQQKEKNRIPYTSINEVEKFSKRLTKIKSINPVGKHFWMTQGNMVGFSDEHNALFVYSTSISRGLLLHRKFEKIIITPEKEDDFIRNLEDKINETKPYSNTR